MEIKDVLHSIGLSPKESDVFLASTKLGPASVLALSKATKIYRPTLYNLINSMIDKGLFHVTIKGKRKLYSAAPPSELTAFLKRKEHSLGEVLPELMALAGSGTGSKPKIEYYEGREQLTNLLWEAVDPKVDQLYSFFPTKHMIEIFGRETVEATIQTRIENKTPSKTLRTRGSEAEFKGFGLRKQAYREVRYAPDNKSPGMGLLIYGDTVSVFASPKENFGLKIVSSSFAKLMRLFFESLWQISKDN